MLFMGLPGTSCGVNLSLILIFREIKDLGGILECPE